MANETPTKIKVIALESIVVAQRIKQQFKEATKKDLFLIKSDQIYAPVKKMVNTVGTYGTEYSDIGDIDDIEDISSCEKQKVFGIREDKNITYALFLMPYVHDTGEGCDYDGNQRHTYQTEWVDSIGVLDADLNLIAWRRDFEWPKNNVSKLYSDVAKVYNTRKIKSDLTEKAARAKMKADRTKMRKEALNRSKEFIKKLEERLTK